MERIADVIVVLQWAAVSAYFIRRFIRHRKLVSLSLAAMSLGWLAIGLGTVAPAIIFKSFAIVLGAFVWFSIWRVERVRPDEQARRTNPNLKVPPDL